MKDNTQISYQTQPLVRVLKTQMMSSKEISQITGKTIGNIHVDIRKMVNELKDDREFNHQQYQEFKDGRNFTKEFLLDKELTTILVSGYSIKMRAKIVRRLDELETQQQAPTTPQPLSNTLEGEILLAKAAADMLRMSDDSKLKMLYQISDGHGLSTGFLPQYVESDETKALTTLLKEFDSKISAVAANKILVELGVLEEKTRPSSTKGVKKFKSLTDEGVFYGKNLVNPNNPRETSPHY
jgi:phage regulator Rha-like protein